MSDVRTLTVTASEIYAALGFHCQAIVANVQQHAAGAPFPSHDALMGEINRIRDLANTLAAMQQEPVNAEAA
jgi:hypothetical protein